MPSPGSWNNAASRNTAAFWKTVFSRTLALGVVVVLIGTLPWLSGQSPEYTILRARYADREATEETLAMIRAELGLDRGPLHTFLTWAGGVLRAIWATRGSPTRRWDPGRFRAWRFRSP